LTGYVGLGDTRGSLGGRLVGSLLLLLLVLSSGECGVTLSLTNFGLLVTLGEDGREVGTDDTTLSLDGLAGTLLGDFLGDTLLVDAPVDGSPGDLARVLALKEERLLLRGNEAE
jgi:hypothetical protein